jgi:hypothetical protein
VRQREEVARVRGVTRGCVARGLARSCSHSRRDDVWGPPVGVHARGGSNVWAMTD